MWLIRWGEIFKVGVKFYREQKPIVLRKVFCLKSFSSLLKNTGGYISDPLTRSLEKPD